MSLHRHISGVRSGFLLLDALMGVMLFSIFIGSVVITLIFSQQSTGASGDRNRGVYLAEQAMEAIRSVRDEDFDMLVPGVHGIVIGDSGTWELAGTGSVTEDGFVTQVSITEISEDEVGFTIHTHWDKASRSGEVYLSGEVTNWHKLQEIGNWTSVSLEGSYIDDATPLFNDIAVSGNYVFVTSEISDGGVGLYVFDISSLTAPVRVAGGFNLGTAGYQLVVDGTNLIVISGDTNMELRMYDISSPETLSSDDLITSYNMPGDGRARSVELYSETLYVGATESASETEFYSFAYDPEGVFTLLDVLDNEGTIYDIALSESYAYLGASTDSSELRVVDIFDPSDLEFAPGGGYNLTDVDDALAVGTFDGFVIVGRQDGDVIEEIVLFDISESPVPSPPPGPWYQEGGDSVHSLAVEPGGRYLFAATSFDSKELQVLDLGEFQGGNPPEVDYYNTATGEGRGVYYDASNDRVYLVTNTALLIIKPGP